MSGGGARTTARCAAIVLVLSALVLFPGVPGASADSCAGVTAVVDFGALGGGVQERCVADGAGQPAWQVFEEAGFSLTAVQQFPDAVCRVSGMPASDPCVRMPPANAYWALFWSTGGGWVYSTTGPRSLTAPAGGSVGFAWQSSTAQRAPGVAASSPAPSPSSKPAKKPTSKPSPKPASAPTPSAGATTTPTPTPSATPTASERASATPTPTAAATTSAPVVASEPEDTTPVAGSDTGGLAWWVPLLVLAVLAGAGGAVWWRRRGTT